MDILYSGKMPVRISDVEKQDVIFREKFQYLMNKRVSYYDAIRPYTVWYSMQDRFSYPMIIEILSHRIIYIVDGQLPELVGAYVKEDPDAILHCQNTLTHVPVNNPERKIELLASLTLLRNEIAL